MRRRRRSTYHAAQAAARSRELRRCLFPRPCIRAEASTAPPRQDLFFPGSARPPSIPDLPRTKKTSKFIVDCVNKRRSPNCLFLAFLCPSCRPFGSILFNRGQQSSIWTAKRHCKKTPTNTPTIISIFCQKKILKELDMLSNKVTQKN